MLPRVTYWTGTWDPGREAISKEVETLRRLHERPAPVVAFSTGNRTGLEVQNRVLKLGGRRLMTFRACAALWERSGEITHAFGRIDAWPMFRALGRRPLVFTAVAPGPPLEARMYERTRVFVAESEALASSLVAAGVRRSSVRVIYPGIDLQEFTPSPPPAGRFRLLFASSPSEPREIEPRGLHLLVALAKRHADMDVVVLWRNWGDAERGLEVLRSLDPPENFRIESLGSRTMAEVYRSVHATACLFDGAAGKSCPNSVVEGLACGRPVFMSDTCGIAQLIARTGAGVVAARDPDALAAGLTRLRDDYGRIAARARPLAEEHFDVREFCRRYIEVYGSLAGGSRTS